MHDRTRSECMMTGLVRFTVQINAVNQGGNNVN